MMALNEETLCKIAEKTPTAESFFEYAAKRKRGVREGISNLAAIRTQMAKDGFHPVPRDLVVMFEDLAKAGIGELKGGEFKWHTSIKEVAGKVQSHLRPFRSAKQTKTPTSERLPEVTTEVQMKINCGTGEVKLMFNKGLTREECDFILATLLKENDL